MESIERLRRRIEVATELHAVVRTMKGIAAAGIHQYERAVESLADYDRTVQMGFQVLLRERGELPASVRRDSRGRIAAIVLGSDQGLCGSFNRLIAAHVKNTPDLLPGRSPLIAAVGERVAAELEIAGISISEPIRLPSSVEAITGTVQDLLMAIHRWQADEGISRLLICHHRPLGGARFEPVTVRLLPMDREWLGSIREKKWPGRQLPAYFQEPESLFRSLVTQYLFGTLFRALAESLASENASRLAAMHAAESNIEERLRGLTFHYHQVRQETITEELLEVVAGFEALNDQ